jgi:hypothetical protein
MIRVDRNCQREVHEHVAISQKRATAESPLPKKYVDVPLEDGLNFYP